MSNTLHAYILHRFAGHELALLVYLTHVRVAACRKVSGSSAFFSPLSFGVMAKLSNIAQRHESTLAHPFQASIAFAYQENAVMIPSTRLTIMKNYIEYVQPNCYNASYLNPSRNPQDLATVTNFAVF